MKNFIENVTVGDEVTVLVEGQEITGTYGGRLTPIDDVVVIGSWRVALTMITAWRRASTAKPVEPLPGNPRRR